jgi:cell division protein FtsI/penicillin-binding protein 2
MLTAHAQQQPAPMHEETASDLYAQATQAMLDRDFASRRIEYLLLDLRSGGRIAMRWEHPERPVPIGSLLKPFLAIAYSQSSFANTSSSQPREFPAIRCHGKSDGCWRAGGHGTVALERAIAESCNAYFLSLARSIADSNTSGVDALRRVAAIYGLPPPPAPDVSGEQVLPRSWIGVTGEWRVTPEALARAYGILASQPGDAIVSRVLAGMRQAAGPQGTAARIGAHRGGVLAKTGTAPCLPKLEPCIADGDGLVVALVPAEQPTLLLLVRNRGTTGARAAEIAGEMLSRIEDSRED